MSSNILDRDDFQSGAELLKATARHTGRHEALNDVLKWALEHKEALERAGLVESLITLCTHIKGD